MTRDYDSPMMWQPRRKTRFNMLYGRYGSFYFHKLHMHTQSMHICSSVNKWECFFFLLTGCDEYLNAHPILSFQTNQPVDLTKASSVSLSATQATSCTFNQTDSVHDYSGFQSRWTTISSGFFNLTMTSGNGKFSLSVRAASLSMIYRNTRVKLSKVASCMAKIAPSWLVSAGYSAWHFFTNGIF